MGEETEGQKNWGEGGMTGKEAAFQRCIGSSSREQAVIHGAGGDYGIKILPENQSPEMEGPFREFRVKREGRLKSKKLMLMKTQSP